MNELSLEHAVKASFVDMLDKMLLVILRDGRHLVGVLRTFDQYSNVVLEDAYEREVFKEMYADTKLGLYVIRGENIVMMGDVDDDKEICRQYVKRVTMEELLKARQEEEEKNGAVPAEKCSILAVKDPEFNM